MALALDSRGMLPPKRHKAPSVDVYDLFVTQAPFVSARQQIWDAFLSWAALVRPLLPTARMWVDGGFVTHKPWAPPRDIDVCLMVSPTTSAGVDAVALRPLLTDHASGGRRVQPMSGLVDSHFGWLGGADAVMWMDTWTSVLDRSRQVTGERKGFVEVIDL